MDSETVYAQVIPGTIIFSILNQKFLTNLLPISSGTSVKYSWLSYTSGNLRIFDTIQHAGSVSRSFATIIPFLRNNSQNNNRILKNL